jgi:hypothetical protein
VPPGATERHLEIFIGISPPGVPFHAKFPQTAEICSTGLRP